MFNNIFNVLIKKEIFKTKESNLLFWDKNEYTKGSWRTHNSQKRRDMNNNETTSA